ncbi:MAG: hypothetical protein D3925_18770 [Candidatus Electrothrix sp. AR5]|nr:hypothetical protein [Candidatus Electrothrix sp. AR5]
MLSINKYNPASYPEQIAAYDEITERYSLDGALSFSAKNLFKINYHPSSLGRKNENCRMTREVIGHFHINHIV